MRLGIFLASALAVSGCVSTPAPNFYNGRYYLAGDADCRMMQAVSDTRISCAGKNGNFTGYRDAMTDQQLQMWQIQVANQRMQMRQLNDSVQQLGQSAQGMAQQFHQQGQQYSAPQVQAIAPLASSRGVTYTQVGQSLVGSNGVTYRRVGSSLIGSDGTTCQIVGQNIICH